MFNSVFAIIELVGLIGVARACGSMHTFLVNHPSLGRSSQPAAWTAALSYGGFVLLLFWLAHLTSKSISMIVFGMSGMGSIVAVGQMLLLGVVVAHVIYGGTLLIPYVARFLAAFSSKTK